MTNAQILTLSRYQLDDENQPYKWSDAELMAYLNDAQKEACRRGYLIVTYPSQVKLTGNSNISFANSTKKITKATGGFLLASIESEVNTFERDDTINVSGTVLNDGDYTISNVTDTDITVLETLQDELNVSAVIEATRTVCRLPLRADVHTYKLHPKTLMVMRARPESLNYPLRQKTLWALDADITIVDYDIGTVDFDSLWYYDSWETLPSGYVFSYIEDNGFIKLIAPPDTSDVLWMVVQRLPKIELAVGDTALSPEIPAVYHADLVDWILHLAYRKQDAETMDLTKAVLFDQTFTKKFGERPSAKTEMNRRRHIPNSRMRPRAFGF